MAGGGRRGGVGGVGGAWWGVGGRGGAGGGGHRAVAEGRLWRRIGRGAWSSREQTTICTPSRYMIQASCEKLFEEFES